MKQKIQQFMIGRYGNDELSKFTLYLLIGLMIIGIFFHNALINILLILGLGIIYFRMFSRNHAKRYAENAKFLQLKNKVIGVFNREKNIAQQRKIYRIYACPGCKQKIRIPKGKGKVEVSCPKCHTSFVKKS